MGQPVDEASTEEEAAPGEDEAAEDESPASELLEQVGRDAGTLVLREGELAASHHIPELRRAARDITAVLGVAVAFITAFALANSAAVRALSSPLPGWRAPLVLTAIWIAVGALLLIFVVARTEHLLGWRWWRALVADPAETVRDREQARDQAAQALRESLDRLAGATAREAGALVAVAVVPLAGGAVDKGEDVIDAVDEMTDVIEEKMPGGGMVNHLADIALMPGRFAVKVANKTLKRSEPENASAKQ